MESNTLYANYYYVGMVIKINPKLPDCLKGYFPQIKKATIKEATCYSNAHGEEPIWDISFGGVELFLSDYYESTESLYYPSCIFFTESESDKYCDAFFIEQEDYVYQNPNLTQEDIKQIQLELNAKVKEIESFTGEPIYVLCNQTVSTVEIKLATPELPIL